MFLLKKFSVSLEIALISQVSHILKIFVFLFALKMNIQAVFFALYKYVYEESF